jgi:hypothetical protein
LGVVRPAPSALLDTSTPRGRWGDISAERGGEEKAELDVRMKAEGDVSPKAESPN